MKSVWVLTVYDLNDQGNPLDAVYALRTCATQEKAKEIAQEIWIEMLGNDDGLRDENFKTLEWEEDDILLAMNQYKCYKDFTYFSLIEQQVE